MATHASTLAWKIPWMEEPGRLQSMGSLGNGRGDPVLSFFIQGNRWVVGVEVRVLSESV